jgi:hypothetical protein
MNFRRAVVLAFAVVVLAVSILAVEPLKERRCTSPSGRVLYTVSGNDVRSPDGKLLGTIRDGQVRTPDGRLIARDGDAGLLYSGLLPGD